MCRAIATPTPPDTEGLIFLNKTVPRNLNNLGHQDP